MTFESDYTQGAHPKILERLVETNMVQESGYGADSFCKSAQEKIRAALGNDSAQITFISGGTQANQIVLDSLARPFEGIVAATTGHINCHEAGAVEFTGRKVLAIPSHDGKIRAGELLKFIEDFESDGSREHMVFPGPVYISFPTEYGTLYSKKELSEIHEVCESRGMPLFIDGARLGYGLASDSCDISIKDLSSLCEAFTIGGTKVGALCGEAVVFTKGNEPAHFQNFVKKHGALMAKGRLMGVQFDTLFTDDLYLKISRRAIESAMLMKEGLSRMNFEFLIDSPTNQQFVILDEEFAKKLAKEIGFSVWEKCGNGKIAVRFATSWATEREEVELLLSAIERLR